MRHAAPRTLRLKLPAGPCTAHLLTWDPNTFTKTMVVSVDGEERARGAELTGRQFQWLRVPLDGGPAGRETDVGLSAKEGQTWHLAACVVLAE
ncbi:hypothetical protein [Streptomyces sp. NPDC050560]|uniref:hypothetical protein n=1 Tax=Streptomyces sp. NPDC050560 TaxID=3365630 RepID=UPI0037969F22